MLEIFASLINWIPLIFFGILMVSVSTIVFLRPNLWKSRLSLIAAYIIGLSVFLILVIIHSPMQKISWGFSTQLPPFSFGGLIIYGVVGIILSFLEIKIIRIFLGNSSLQAAILFLTGGVSFLAFYYFFADEQTANVVSALVFGCLVGLLLQIARKDNVSLRLFPVIDHLLVDATKPTVANRARAITLISSLMVFAVVFLLAGWSAEITGTPMVLVPSNTPSMTPSSTFTPTITPTQVPSPTALPSTSTQTGTPLPTATPTNFPTFTPTPTKTLTSTTTSTLTLTNTATNRPTATPFGGGTGEISLVSKDRVIAAIYVVNLNNSSSRLLTPLTSENWSPSWSPDGQFVAFESNRDRPWDIYSMDTNGLNVRRLTSIGQNWFPAWSPNGKQIAFQSDRTGRWEIWVMSSYGTGVQQLTSNSGQNGYPAWSPDSQQLAFQSDQSGNWEIYIMAVNGSSFRRLTTTGSNNQSPNWSPNGKEIAFQSDRSGSWEIYVMDTNGSNVRSVTSDGNQNEVPAWSPDGKHIAFQSGRGSTKKFSIIDPNGLNLISLNTYHGVGDGILAWVP